MEKGIVEREYFYDTISGIMIIQMMALHIINQSNLNYLLYIPIHILSFFMPWFFFKSGVFFKVRSDKIKQSIYKSYKRLIIPFIIFGCIGILIYTGILIINNHSDIIWPSIIFSIKNGIPTLGNAPLWYLLSLFVIKLILYFTINKIPYYVLIIVSVLIPSLMYYLDFNEWTIISHTLLGLFYFMCGYKLSKIQYENFILYTAIVVFLICLLYSPSSIDFVHNNLDYGEYLMDFPYSLSAIIIINNLFKRIPWHFVEKLKLHIVGKNSMTLLVSHMLVLSLCIPIYKLAGINSPIYIGIFLFIALIITMPISIKLFNHPKLSWCVGNK